MALTKTPIELSSTPGIVDNSNATAITIDSSENVTLTGEIIANGGIALPDSQKATFGAGDDLKIHHNGSNSFIQDSGTGDLIIAGTNLSLRNYATDEIFLDGTSNAAVRVFYNGAAKLATTNTGIDVTGTASATSVTAAQHLTAGSAYSVLFGDGGERISGNNSSSLLSFFTGATERMRIDGSGHLLVGKTSATFGNVGVENRADGRITSTRSGNTNLVLNRLSSDGNIVQFYKDGTSVGSIGSVAGARPYFAGNNVGLSPYNNIIYPTNVSGATSNGAVDLGASGQRFKDLYLSGGVYLGGTGAANKLDDYEEGSGSSVVKVGGTVVTQSSSRGYKYVKVGNIVTFYFEFRVGNLNGGTGEATIDLPFTCGEYGVGGVRVYNGAVVGTEFLGVSPGSTLCKFKTNVNNTATGNMALTVNGYYYGSVTYIVS